ncbi:hypothetical protein [Nesterenkonia sp. K-15-9-6]|uniref:hypothetical protein n=1 Tax=Nesterenkonia sp. K-15-9-6 TaxID=3093918 RepID=UPI00404451AA
MYSIISNDGRRVVVDRWHNLEAKVAELSPHAHPWVLDDGMNPEVKAQSLAQAALAEAQDAGYADWPPAGGSWPRVNEHLEDAQELIQQSLEMGEAREAALTLNPVPDLEGIVARTPTPAGASAPEITWMLERGGPVSGPGWRCVPVIQQPDVHPTRAVMIRPVPGSVDPRGVSTEERLKVSTLDLDPPTLDVLKVHDEWTVPAPHDEASRDEVAQQLEEALGEAFESPRAETGTRYFHTEHFVEYLREKLPETPVEAEAWGTGFIHSVAIGDESRTGAAELGLLFDEGQRDGSVRSIHIYEGSQPDQPSASYTSRWLPEPEALADVVSQHYRTQIHSRREHHEFKIEDVSNVPLQNPSATGPDGPEA